MRKRKIIVNDELLAKYLVGEASEAESALVLAWINENEHNRKYFEHFKLIYEEAKGFVGQAGLNVDDAWQRFRQRTQLGIGAKTNLYPFHIFRSFRLAAAIIILLGIGYLILTTVRKDRNSNYVRTSVIVDTASKNAEKSVCNNTACPIQVCITQIFKCNNFQSSEVTTCSTLEPDESGRLSYKAFNSMNRNCVSMIKEITIKMLATGETIVLDDHSAPVNAQDMFMYITGQKKGDIVAGVFHTNCDNDRREHGLRLDNVFGDLIFQ